MPTISLVEINELRDAIGAGTKKGRILDPIPQTQHQEGPNCGFYALSIVMDYWKAKGITGASAPARARDTATQGRETNEGRSLRSIGKEAGVLGTPNTDNWSSGGVFTAAQLAEVAKAVQFARFRARIKTWKQPMSFVLGICNVIDSEVPPIVAFDVQKGGDPMSDGGGQHSHWGVVLGYFEIDKKVNFVATHGHGAYYRWLGTELQESNFALANTVRNIESERKMRLTGAGTVHKPSVAKARNWHWRKASEIEAVKLAAPKAGFTVEERGESRPPVSYAQDLAYHLVIVDPR
jgi:hypothetical protein